jgi:hypothetical protein
MPVLEASRETKESRVLQKNCLFEYMAIVLEENGDGKIHITIIKEKEAKLSDEDKSKTIESYRSHKSMG